MQQRQQQCSFSQASSNAVRVFLNMPLPSCKLKYNINCVNKVVWSVFSVAYVALFVDAKVQR